MPRNGSGIYSLPQPPFVAGTTIASSPVNSDFSDIASALTGSVATNGESSITGQLKGVTGSAGAPAYSFATNLTSGVFLNGVGILGLSAGGTEGILISSVGSTAASAVPAAAGSGYAVGDTITLAGGTSILATVLQVATLSGSGVATVTVLTAGQYSSVPSNPAAQASSSGAGTGATFTVTYSTVGLISDLGGAALWTDMGASTYMASIMGTPSAAALSVAINGADTTPPVITISQNDYAPTGLASSGTLRLNPTANVNITGLASGGIADQQRITLMNISATNMITLTASDSASLAPNRFLIGRPALLRPGQAIVLQYDTASTGWRAGSCLTSDPPSAQFKNLRIQVTGNTAVTVSADDVTLENTSAADSSAIPDISFFMRSGKFSVSLGLGSVGLNGLETGGAIAIDTFYSVWAISNGVTTATVASVSSTNPNLSGAPFLGYTFKARIGWVQTIHTAATLYNTLQVGRVATYVFGSGVSGGIVPVNASVPGPLVPSGTGVASIITPTTVVKTVLGSGLYAPVTATRVQLFADNNYKGGGPGVIVVAGNSTYQGVNNGPNGTNGVTWPYGDSAGVTGNGSFWLTLESSTLSAATGAGAIVTVGGWEDNI